MAERKNDNQAAWNRVYDQQTPEEIFWNFETVPAWFCDIAASGWLTPGRTLDIGCGLGNYSNFLAEQGHDVVGVDLSLSAIVKNKSKYPPERRCFLQGSALDLTSVLAAAGVAAGFDTLIDVSLFHHISLADRDRYAAELAAALRPGGHYLLCCFNVCDPVFSGQLEFPNPGTDTTAYALTSSEIVATFESRFDFAELAVVEFGKLSQIGNSPTRKRHLVKMIRR